MRIAALIVLFFIAHPALAANSHAVKGYTKKDGTYVQGHKQTNPDQLRRNNYSSDGNYNPNTGKQGKQRNELSNPPKYNDSYDNGQGKQLNQINGDPPKKSFRK
jgi:hypothetical protein